MAIVSTAEIAKLFDEIRDQRDSANKRAEQAEAEAQQARYEATMEAARKVYDIAIVYKEAGDTQEYSALIQAFNKIVTCKAANP